jgi:hypothetical protein
VTLTPLEFALSNLEKIISANVLRSPELEGSSASNARISPESNSWDGNEMQASVAQEGTDKHIFCIAIITHVIIVAFFIMVDYDVYSGLEALVLILRLRFFVILGHLDLFLLISCELKDLPRYFWVKSYLIVM